MKSPEWNETRCTRDRLKFEKTESFLDWMSTSTFVTVTKAYSKVSILKTPWIAHYIHVHPYHIIKSTAGAESVSVGA